MRYVPIMIVAALAACPALAADDHHQHGHKSPYAGEQTRGIKALSDEDDPEGEGRHQVKVPQPFGALLTELGVGRSLLDRHTGTDRCAARNRTAGEGAGAGGGAGVSSAFIRGNGGGAGPG